MAWFLVHAHLSPQQYKELTLVERESLIETLKASRA
jgi:hypothetical protein